MMPVCSLNVMPKPWEEIQGLAGRQVFLYGSGQSWICAASLSR